MLAPRRAASHEDLFVARYAWLMQAAVRVTEGDRQAAEDLVQDAFIRFTLVQPPLEEVEHLDAYLYVMLRNMHASRVRRRGRPAEVSLSILDFDSLTMGLGALDTARSLEARQTLQAACEYGCVRRHSSKAGSIFLLRFVLGYTPSEIARITGLSATLVDDRVYRARREANLYVRHPGQLAFIGPDRTVRARPTVTLVDEPRSEDALLVQLRSMIFSERHASCWSRSALLDLYRSDKRETLTREQLAALVACPVCLDEVNAILNLPRLATRWPTDTLGPGRRTPALIVASAVMLWLLFWTPGLEVSAAEHIARTLGTLKRFVVELVSPSPAPSAARPSSAGAPAAAPKPMVDAPPAPRQESTVRPAVNAAPRRLAAAKRTALELKALSQLQQAGSYLGQEVAFGPLDEAHVALRVTVDGADRKQVVTRALGPLVKSREVSAEIVDLREAVVRINARATHEQVSTRGLLFVRDQFPMFEPLRQHLGDDREVRLFAMRMLERSRHALQHAWALKLLADRFAAPTIGAASAETQALWRGVVREHTRGYQQELASIREALDPLVDAAIRNDGGLQESTLRPDAIASDAWGLVERLLALQKAQDEAIRSAFAIRTGDAAVSIIQTPAFWRQLDEADTVAAALMTALDGTWRSN